MSLHDAIAGLNDAFFDADAGFAEEVIYSPLGVAANEFPINAVVDWGDEEGTNQIRGEGRSNLNADRGRSTRSTPVIELPTTRIVRGVRIPVTVSETGKDRVIVKKHGSDEKIVLTVKRIIARDEAAQSVLCHITNQHQTQPRKSRFG